MRTPAGPPPRDLLHKVTGSPNPEVIDLRTDAAADQAPGTDNLPIRVAPPLRADTAGPASTAPEPDKPIDPDASGLGPPPGKLAVLAEPIALITAFIGYGA